MPHAAKPGVVIYNGVFVGLLQAECVFYCSDFCYLVDLSVSRQLISYTGYHWRSLFNLQQSFHHFIFSVLMYFFIYIILYSRTL